MRVALNLMAAVVGGQLSRARAFLDRFAAQAPDAHLIVFKERGILDEYRSDVRQTIIDVEIGAGPLRVFRRLWWENTSMPSSLRELRADVYLTFSSYLPQLNLIRTPTVVGVSNLAPFCPQAEQTESFKNRLRLFMLRRTIVSSARRATRVVALSRTCKEILEDRGIDSDKITIAPNGVDPFWSVGGSAVDVPPGKGITKPYVLYVSHFYRYKNHLRLIEAFSSLPQEVRTAHQLVMVGLPMDRNYFEAARRLIAAHGLGTAVVVLPGEDKMTLRALYQNAKAFVFPSIIENCPNILLEAMMAGAPVAVSRCQPMPEFCGAAGVYFDAFDKDDMARTLLDLIRDENGRIAMKQRSQARAAQFTWDDFVMKVEASVRSAARS